MKGVKRTLALMSPACGLTFPFPARLSFPEAVCSWISALLSQDCCIWPLSKLPGLNLHCLLDVCCYFHLVSSIFNPRLILSTSLSLCVVLPSLLTCCGMYLLNLVFLCFSFIEVPLGSFSFWPVFFLKFFTAFFFFLLLFSIPSFDFNHFIHVFSPAILVSEVLGGFILLFLRSVEPCS